MVSENIKSQENEYICVLGLGYVGLTLAVTLADVGFKVHGVEIKDDILNLLANGKSHFYEPGLEKKLKRLIRSDNLIFSKNINKNLQIKTYIITVGTPLSPDKRTRLDMIKAATKQVAQKLKSDDLVIMRSTVKIGVTNNIVAPILNEVGCKYNLAFCPERTLEGNALEELRTLPQIIGGSTHTAVLRASELFQSITPTIVRVSNLETAELIKLIDNAQRDVSFAYANEVARACDAIGVSAIEIIKAGKQGYSRTNLPMPGPVGGPCLEKDSYILSEGLLEYGFEPEITLVSRRANEKQPENTVNYLKGITSNLNDFNKTPTITLLGIAFKGKPVTDDLRGTMAKPVLNSLKKHFPDGHFRAYDAVVNPKDLKNIGLEPVKTIKEAFLKSSLVIIMNNHNIFSTLNIEDLSKLMKKPGIIYDFWNFYKTTDLKLPKDIFYIALGSHGLANLPLKAN